MKTMSRSPFVLGPSYGDIAVELNPALMHPNTLVEGKHYVYMDRYDVEASPLLLDVKFVAYTPCPAIVVVLNGSGQKVRILRDDLYTKSYSSQHVFPWKHKTTSHGTKHNDSSTEYTSSGR